MGSLSFFLFGLIFGSFANCVIYRLNHNKNPLKGRSFCPQCHHQLAWNDNIPLFSFLILKGKCRYCRKKISWQYPLVELSAGILFLLISLSPNSLYSLSSPSCLLTKIYLCFLAIDFLIIFVSDLLYWTIPDETIIAGLLVTLLSFLIPSFSLLVFLNHLVTAFISFLFFFLLNRLTKGKGMAWGDVKLAFLLGLALGYPQIVVALYLAFTSGALIGLILIFLKKKKLRSPLPFGPFLTGATLVTFFIGLRLIELYKQLISFWVAK